MDMTSKVFLLAFTLGTLLSCVQTKSLDERLVAATIRKAAGTVEFADSNQRWDNTSRVLYSDRGPRIVLCPDGGSYCPDGNTCCPSGSSASGYGCCPAVNAVCCSDGVHCCPSGTTCDVTNGYCLARGITTRMMNKLPATYTEPKIVLCPGGGSYCPDGNTCCPNSSASGYGCCPAVNAVCCSDGVHCCPSGTTCDVTNGYCLARGITTRMMNKLPATYTEPKIVLCPGGGSYCPDGNTCCPNSSASGYGCCPAVNAVCCSDGVHCCPSGTTCDVTNGYCLARGITTRMMNKLPATYTEPKIVICPGGGSYCPDGNTCCPNSSASGYGCCPAVNAVCCSDGVHCCPSGTTCDVTNGYCLARGITTRMMNKLPATYAEPKIVICPGGGSYCPDGNTCCPNSSASGYGCCPAVNAVCCSDGVHCCPTGTTCDVTNGYCLARGIATRMMNKLPATYTEPKIVLCPGGGSYCPDGNTCCPNSSASGYGCCPAVNAVCCSDGVHCCPTGTTCDVTNGYCLARGIATRMMNKLPATYTEPKIVLCPGGGSYCPDGNTCCPNSSASGYGCCPAVNAVCCSDGVHCCPSGTTCDVTNGYCLAKGITTRMMRKLPATYTGGKMLNLVLHGDSNLMEMEKSRP